MKSFKSPEEQKIGPEVAEVFDNSSDTIEARIESFPRYVRRQQLTRFLALYEIFKRTIPAKGSVVECGVFRGFGLMSWAKFSAILEPNNLTRRIYGFDTYGGFPSVNTRDVNAVRTPVQGDLASDSFDELTKLIDLYDRDRFLGHIDKVHFVSGDAAVAIPKFMREHPHVIVSLCS